MIGRFAEHHVVSTRRNMGADARWTPQKVVGGGDSVR